MLAFVEITGGQFTVFLKRWRQDRHVEFFILTKCGSNTIGKVAGLSASARDDNFFIFELEAFVGLQRAAQRLVMALERNILVTVRFVVDGAHQRTDAIG